MTIGHKSLSLNPHATGIKAPSIPREMNGVYNAFAMSERPEYSYLHIGDQIQC